MYVPCARERVRIAGRMGVFLVVRVDPDLQRADLISLHSDDAEEGVSFFELEPYREDDPR